MSNYKMHIPPLKHSDDIWKELWDKGPSTDEEWNLMVENEPQHVTYIDEILWLLEDSRRVAHGCADIEVLQQCIENMSDGIVDWLENLKEVLL